MTDIQGVKELSKQLSELGKQAGGKALRSAVSAAATVIKREAKINIPKGRRAHKTYKGRLVAPGFASRNIISRTKTNASRTKVTARIGVRREAFYAVQFVEIGTKNMRAKPWLERSMRAQKQQALSRFKQKLRANIAKVANDK